MIGKRLKELRLKKGYTQQELSLTSGINAAAISHIETDSRSPSLENFVRLCKGLDCSPSLLLNWSKIKCQVNI